MNNIDRSGNRFQGSEKIDFNEVTEELMDKSNWGPEAWHMECLNGRTELGYYEWLCERGKKNHVTEEAKMEITHEKKELFPNSKGAMRREALFFRNKEAHMISMMVLGSLDPKKVTVEVDQGAAYIYNGQNMGVFVETAIQALDSCVCEKWYEGAPKGKVLNDIVLAIGQQWPFGKKRTYDLEGNVQWIMCPKNPWEKSMIMKLKAAIDLNRERLQERKESQMMKWNSGEREAGFAELCTSNAGISQYQRNEQEWDIWNRRADEVLLRAQEKNTGFLSPDKERFEQAHKALRMVVKAIRNEDKEALNRFRNHWVKSTKSCTKKRVVKVNGQDEVVETYKPRQGSWAPTPKSVLMLLSHRLRAQMVLKHITYNQWLSLAEKVSRTFRALGVNNPSPAEKGLPQRDEEMIALMEDNSKWADREPMSDWEEAAIMSEGLNPEELVSMMQEYQE